MYASKACFLSCGFQVSFEPTRPRRVIKKPSSFLSIPFLPDGLATNAARKADRHARFESDDAVEEGFADDMREGHRLCRHSMAETLHDRVVVPRHLLDCDFLV
jgi:hypothetical protein